MAKEITATIAWFPDKKGDSWRVYFSDRDPTPNLKYHQDFMYRVYDLSLMVLEDRVRNSIYDYAYDLNNEGIVPSKSTNLASLVEILSGDY